ncbi:DUF2846 domain-containing protein [Sulfurospirillum arcachonense]|uniref:DUF2846 domain-containing protein n=1 Tax=Sulfurospirillum arcachonense TaxID=57666 RepID=UPI00046A4B95|nr:DUF2846 domain-containing protein [Sulfurospirillum arcachonense]
MQIFKILVVSVFLVLGFVGCNSSSPSPAQINLKSGKGAIVVYRPHNKIWRHKRFNIYINDKYEDTLINRSHHVFDKKPGEYIIELREDIEINPEIFKVKVHLNLNKIKYIRLGTQSIEDHLKLKVVKKFIAIDDSWYQKRY